MNTRKNGHLKRVIATALSVMMLSGYVPTDAFAEITPFEFKAHASMTDVDCTDYFTNGVLSIPGGEYKEQIKWTNLNKLKVTEIKVEAGKTVTFYDCTNLFKFFSNVTKIDLTNCDTSNVESMTDMFSGCAKLKQVILGTGFNTDKVTTMANMFEKCSSLEQVSVTAPSPNADPVVDISSFNTNRPIALPSMFLDCYSMKKLDLGDLHTYDPGTPLSAMLSGCTVYKTDEYGDLVLDENGDKIFLGVEEIHVGQNADINKAVDFPELPVDNEGHSEYLGWVKKGKRDTLTAFSKDDKEDTDVNGITYVLLKKEVSIASFDPAQIQISSDTDIEVKYKGENQIPTDYDFKKAITIIDPVGNFELEYGEDYTIDVEPKRDVGNNYTYKIKGKSDRYSEKAEDELSRDDFVWSITPAPLGKPTINIPNNYTYDGKPASEHVDFTVIGDNGDNGLVGTDKKIRFRRNIYLVQQKRRCSQRRLYRQQQQSAV